jgi:hypothetical protein
MLYFYGIKKEYNVIKGHLLNFNESIGKIGLFNHQ